MYEVVHKSTFKKQSKIQKLANKSDTSYTQTKKNIIEKKNIFREEEEYDEEEEYEESGKEEEEEEEDDEEENEDKLNNSFESIREMSRKEDEVQRVLMRKGEERTDSDVDVLVDSFKHMAAFSSMGQSLIRKICALMSLQRYHDAYSVVLEDGEELMRWYVVLEGEMKVTKADGSIDVIFIGQSFGLSDLSDTLHYQEGQVSSNKQHCELGYVEKEDFIKIFHEYSESMLNVVEDGKVVMVMEKKLDGNTEDHIVIQATKDNLMKHLLDARTSDPTYIDDFLLTYRAFIHEPCDIMNFLLELFKEKSDKNKIARVILQWTNCFHKDFERNKEMKKLMETFKALLTIHSMTGSLKMLEMTQSSHAKERTFTLKRSDKTELLGIWLVDAQENGIKGIYVKKVDPASKSFHNVMKEGDQILEVNNRVMDNVNSHEAICLLKALTHIFFKVKYNCHAYGKVKEYRNEKKQSIKTKYHTINNKYNNKQSNLQKVSFIDNSNEAETSLTQNVFSITRFAIDKLSTSLTDETRIKSVSDDLSPDIHKNKYRFFNSQDDLDNKSDKSNDEVDDKEGECDTTNRSGSFLSLSRAKKMFSSFRSWNRSGLEPLSAGISSLPQSPSFNFKKPNFLNVPSFSRKSAPSTPLIKKFNSSSQSDIFKVFSLHNSFSTYPENDIIVRMYYDSSYKNIYISQNTKCQELIELGISEFVIKESSQCYSLCEVIFEKDGLIRTRTLPLHTTNLFERISLNARYFLKHIETPLTIPDDMADDVAQEMDYDLLDIPHSEVTVRLTLRAIELYHMVDPSEHVVDLFNNTPSLTDANGENILKNLKKFSELSNKEMFWVPTVVCSETNINKRSKLIRHFIKIAKGCKKAQNFNSSFSIVSGLRHGSVSRLKNTWDKVHPKDLKTFEDLQTDMDPTRNMARYRSLLNHKCDLFPMIPFYPMFKKDLTFIDLGNDTITKPNNLINFEKMRMVAKEIRTIGNLTKGSYKDKHKVFKPFQQSTSTIKRFHVKSYERSIQSKKAIAYLEKLQVVVDEKELFELSYQCECSNRNQSSCKTPTLSSLTPFFTPSSSSSLLSPSSSSSSSGFSSIYSITSSSSSSSSFSSLSSSQLSLVPKNNQFNSMF